MNHSNETNIPGATGVIRIHGGNGFYCTVHKLEIQPLMVEVEGDETACCEECILEDIISNGGEIKQAISAEKDEPDPVFGRDIWDECYT